MGDNERDLLNLIKANVKVIQVVSYETLRIHAMGYDAAQLFIKTVSENGGADTGKLKKALSSVQDYNGLSGKISFDPQTGANEGIVIMKVTETGFIRVH